ncbi:MAG TPA: DUF58 domain-containing protein [Myxococcaceae bacterium]|nr:DUF58 domain-containing protein [Myxococcaceae bacterium]
MYLLLTLGVGLGALNTGNNLLFLLVALLLSTIVVSGVMSERCLRHLAVERLPASAAFAGEPFAIHWRLRAARAPAFALTVSEAGRALPAEAACAYLPAGTERVLRAPATAGRRGPLDLTGIRVTTEFPFGLFAKSRTFSCPGTVLVFPKRSGARGQPRESRRRHHGDQPGSSAIEGSGEVVDFRELFEGEDARRVHWKKSAAAGKLLHTVREREEHSAYVLHIPGHLEGEPLDRECERAAASARWLLTRGNEVGLEAPHICLAPGRGPRQEWQLLCALAWAGFQRGGDQ